MLAITNAMRSAALPEVDTVEQAGFPELSFGGFLGLFAPKAMNIEQREYVAAEVRHVLQEPGIRERLTTIGLIARGTTPAEFQAVLDEQRSKWAAIASEFHIMPQ